jgi:hypothetical protein
MCFTFAYVEVDFGTQCLVIIQLYIIIISVIYSNVKVEEEENKAMKLERSDTSFTTSTKSLLPAVLPTPPTSQSECLIDISKIPAPATSDSNSPLYKSRLSNTIDPNSMPPNPNPHQQPLDSQVSNPPPSSCPESATSESGSRIFGSGLSGSGLSGSGLPGSGLSRSGISGPGYLIKPTAPTTNAPKGPSKHQYFLATFTVPK